MQTGQLFFTAAHADYTVFLKLKLGQITSSHTGNNVNFVPFFKISALSYVTETNTYHAFLPFDTPIRKIGFCPEWDSNPCLPDY